MRALDLGADVGLGRAGQDAAVDLDDCIARDHVVLDAGLDDVRAERVADQGPQSARIHRVAQPVDRAVRRVRVELTARDRAQRRGCIAGECRGGGLEEPDHHRRHPDRPGHGQSYDDVGGEDSRVVVARHRAVAPVARDVDAVRDEALLGDLDRIEPPAGHRHRHAAAFVHRSRSPQPFRAMRGEPAGTVGRARLLVGRAGEQHVSSQAWDRIPGGVAAGRAGLVDQPLDDAELEGDHALHVDRAAAVDVAVGDIGRERVVRPAIGRCRDDVEVRQQEERFAAGPVTPQAGVDGAATRGGLDDLGVEAERPEAPFEIARGARLLVGRRRGRAG